MSGSLSGAREARPSRVRRIVARALAWEHTAFVVPGPEVVRARDLDLPAAGLQVAATSRHASVLVVVGGLPPGLRGPAAVAYAQMPRPRAVLALGDDDISPLPGPDVSVEPTPEALRSGVAELRRLFEGGSFSPWSDKFEAGALRSTTEYACPMHPEVVQDEPGTCPRCSMELMPREAGVKEEAGGLGPGNHEHDEHDASGETEDEGGASDHGEAGHEGHDHDHGDMDFMSMVEMTQGTPRSSDGLQMEWVEAPFGPLFPGLPGGLALAFTLDGDTVAETEVGSVVGVRMEDLGGPASSFADRLARLDPLSPVSYRLLALHAVEDAAGVEVDEETALGRVAVLERGRAASHLSWLAGFGYLIGYPWFARRVEELQLATLRAGTGDAGQLRAEVQKLARRLGRTPLLRRKLAGIALLADPVDATGPIARAAGRKTDARVEKESYLFLGFEPVVEDRNDALARLRVRLTEIEQSLDLFQRAGAISEAGSPTCAGASGSGEATLETPRGAATLRVSLEDGEVTSVQLDTPSSLHLRLVEAVTEQREVADALAGVGSLDLSPWEVVG